VGNRASLDMVANGKIPTSSGNQISVMHFVMNRVTH
jgi:hypothetical protein